AEPASVQFSPAELFHKRAIGYPAPSRFSPPHFLAPSLQEPADHRRGGLVARLVGAAASLVGGRHDREVTRRRNPDGAVVLVVAAVVRQHASPPAALGHDPAESIVTAERRRVELPEGGRGDETVLPPRS